MRHPRRARRWAAGWVAGACIATLLLLTLTLPPNQGDPPAATTATAITARPTTPPAPPALPEPHPDSPRTGYRVLRAPGVAGGAHPLLILLDVQTPLAGDAEPPAAQAPSAPAHSVVVVSSEARAAAYLALASGCGVVVAEPRMFDLSGVLGVFLSDTFAYSHRVQGDAGSGARNSLTTIISTTDSGMSGGGAAGSGEPAALAAAAEKFLSETPGAASAGCKLVAPGGVGDAAQHAHPNGGGAHTAGDGEEGEGEGGGGGAARRARRVIVSYGLLPAVVSGDVTRLQQRLEGFDEDDMRSRGAVGSMLTPVQCTAFRTSDLKDFFSGNEEGLLLLGGGSTGGGGLLTAYDFASVSLWKLQMALRKNFDPDSGNAVSSLPEPVALPSRHSDLVSPRGMSHLLDEFAADFLLDLHRRRSDKVKGVPGVDSHTSLLGTQLYWDTLCSCTGFNIEAAAYLTELEKFLQVRAVAERDCWCRGHPAETQKTLQRLIDPKDLDTVLGQSVAENQRASIWVSHKPPEWYPTFPYAGAISLAKRPDYVIGRSMIESDTIPSAWLHALKGSRRLIDELWIPSRFLLAPLEKLRLDIPVRVIPESVDVGLYNPETTQPYPGLPDGFKFLSVFKWEQRKGWDILLKAFFTMFKRHDSVSLVLKTHLYMEGDAHNPDKITRKISKFARTNGFNLADIPMVHVIAEEIDEVTMPMVYRACDCFVLPTRGEGWGLGMHQAMAMGLPTIATNWSGNTEFMTPETSVLLRLNRTERAQGFPGKWAVPDLYDLMHKMRWAVDSPEERAAMGRRAREHIVANFSQQAVVPMIVKRVSEIRSSLLEARGKQQS